MSQTIHVLVTSNKWYDDVARHNTNIATLRSQFSGATFPSSPTTGQPCWRTDRGLDTVAGKTGKLYFFSGDTDIGEAGWISSETTSTYIVEIENARGSKATLDQRLDIALNEDGTLKAGGAQYSSEWTTPALTFTYLTTTTFKTNGNTEDIYLETRRLKVNLSVSNFKTEVVSAVYSGGADETTVTIADASLDNTLASVEHAIISPIADGGALTAKMIKSANEEIDLSIDLNVTSDANYILTADENLYGRMELTTSLFSAPRDIITDNTEHTFLFVNNEAFDVTVKTSAGTGVVVPVGEARLLRNDGVNIIHQETSNVTLWNKETLTINFTSDADLTLTAEQERYGKIILTDSGVVLTTARNVIFSTKKKDFIVQNDTLQTLTPKTSAGTGIATLVGAKVWLLCDGTNVIKSIDDTSGGTILQVVEFSTTTFAVNTAYIPNDDTIPQITEGVEYMQLGITPLEATSKLKITISLAMSSLASFIGMAIFKNSGAAAVISTIDTVSFNNHIYTTSAVFMIDAVSTDAATYKFRMGGDPSVSLNFNGGSGARKHGGSLVSSMIIEEIKV